jgi:hypothetical protein
MLWALTTFSAHVIDGVFGDRRQFFEKLSTTVDLKRLHSKAAFVQMLKSWPWVDSWHQPRVSAVWEEVLVGRGRRWRYISTQDNPDKCIEKKSRKFYAGILLFYAS